MLGSTRAKRSPTRNGSLSIELVIPNLVMNDSYALLLRLDSFNVRFKQLSLLFIVLISLD